MRRSNHPSSEAYRIVELATPLALVQLAQVAISTTDMLMLGWVGGEALAAGALGLAVFNLLRTIGFGLIVGTSNLVAAEPGDRVPISLLFGALVVSAGAGLIAMGLMVFGGAGLRWLGQDANVAELAWDYLTFLAPGIVALFGFYAYRGVVVGRRKAGFLLAITLATILINAVLDYGLLFGAFGLPQLGVPGVAAASTLAYLAQFVAIACITHRTMVFSRLSSMAELLASIRRLLATGLPTAGSYGSEAGFTALVTLMVGVWGAAALAAQAVVNQMVYVVFMLSIGLSHATSVGVSEAVGGGDHERARRVGRTGLLLGMAVAAVFALAFLLFSAPLLALFSLSPGGRGEATYRAAQTLLIVAALVQLPDFAQNIGIGALRGVGRAASGFWITLASYWLIGAPAAWLMGFHLVPGATGVWIGMGTGFAAAAIGLIAAFHRATGGFVIARRVSEQRP
ncbi:MULTISPECIES: MATE family efflux transporter [unclassified Ensifer]|uniref:MATE family efflux transporter n=1 Tax=unclassified Ensifer TaxID=2633371 RepID=UPI0008139CFA|nr:MULTISPECIES: MATE family efflux transporter [unclassified Ensifer]OCP02751.1 MATE family efflux transporter [Ensifer sp. LC14]OCP13652.1 MATE family efflux transporter [Ensifer sp. LC13]OCP14311.1 MATE family efflux transporter [Ensifer sp. LC11]OCP29014.1 MATE family efflux transporter [Ensifer sp. LC499]